ncbi:hypothetical protein RA2_03244 [Roseovarius sp. A-2]|uniref:DUF2177 family protein n=1 Tax=Roseovarius sp. A-2 TaxID=1570360 RepID=UPI0009C71303|nr:DUF2177 family protein [Roseovarius sp. A-2]GAW36175.1 hypothetical protein RA2_03244 [Roseovarius sp. A-2]
MSLLVLVLVTGAIFLVADAIMLSTVMQPLFAQHLGETLRPGIRPLPAVLFYLIYMAGVIWFAGWPALRDGTPRWWQPTWPGARHSPRYRPGAGSWPPGLSGERTSATFKCHH